MKEKTAEKENDRETSEETQETKVDKMIRRHVYAALGVGLIPIPFLDFAGVTGVQLNLLRKLAQIYNIPFSENLIKNVIGAIIGGAFPASAGPLIASSIAKTVPVIGHIVGAAGSAGVSGACTYAIGRVFSRHFAEGGTFLSFDAEKAREFYEEMFREGQEVVAEMNMQKTKQ